MFSEKSKKHADACRFCWMCRHLCVHFLRDMDECQKNDPNYGVQNQNAIRKKWKELTGITVN